MPESTGGELLVDNFVSLTCLFLTTNIVQPLTCLFLATACLFPPTNIVQPLTCLFLTIDIVTYKPTSGA